MKQSAQDQIRAAIASAYEGLPSTEWYERRLIGLEEDQTVFPMHQGPRRVYCPMKLLVAGFVSLFLLVVILATIYMMCK